VHALILTLCLDGAAAIRPSACWHVPGSLGFERLAMITSGASKIAIKCYVIFTYTQPILAHDLRLTNLETGRWSRWPMTLPLLRGG
jgi:hypothetical protein